MSAGSVEVSDEDKRRHREVEKSLKEVRVQFRPYMPLFESISCTDYSVYHQAKQKLASQVKVRRDDSQV
jgi:hypothetical protein